MANSKSRLGRGLGGLITGTTSATAKKASPTKGAAPKQKAELSALASSKGQAPTQAPIAATAAVSDLGYRDIAIKDLVANPYQPRREIDPKHVEEMARSIKAEGLLQPIVVRAKGKQFELIAGERRLRAFEFLKQERSPIHSFYQIYLKLNQLFTHKDINNII